MARAHRADTPLWHSPPISISGRREKTMQWKAAPGEFDMLVGSSAQQIELRGRTTLK